jgi:heme-degrading monooxygenase HmoA
MYARVWEYEVRTSDVEAFLAAYGASGAWVKLFERSEGYDGTQLFRDVDRAGRFLTVDRWTDYASWKAFLDRWGSDYRELDQRLRRLADGGQMIVEGLAEGL